MARQSKRVLACSDLHSGHMVGLTPPAYQFKLNGGRVSAEEAPVQKIRNKAARIQRATWEFWRQEIDKLKPIDIVIVNGDSIDGKGSRSGATELISADCNAQVEMAAVALLQTEAKHYVFTRGTPYHTGEAEDFEDLLADTLARHHNTKSVKIGNHEWVDVNGVVFDCKHKIGSSQVPHGRFTALARDVLWNLLWSVQEEQPRADVVLRSHVHYHVYLGGGDEPLAMTLPALQAMGTKFGSRQCCGRVHFGFVHFDVDAKGGVTWEPHIKKIAAQKATVTKL